MKLCVSVGNAPFAIEVGGGQAIGDVLGKMMSGRGGFPGKRVEKQRVTIAEAFPLVEEAEMEKKLAGVDIMKEAIRCVSNSQ